MRWGVGFTYTWFLFSARSLGSLGSLGSFQLSATFLVFHCPSPPSSGLGHLSSDSPVMRPPSPSRYPQTWSHFLASVPSSLLHYCPKTLENKKHPLVITLMKYLEGKELSVYVPVASLMGVSFSLHKEIMNRKHYLFILINPSVYLSHVCIN